MGLIIYTVLSMTGLKVTDITRTEVITHFLWGVIFIFVIVVLCELGSGDLFCLGALRVWCDLWCGPGCCEAFFGWWLSDICIQ